MNQAPSVHMLWLEGPLSRIARLSLASFANCGFRVDLWSYDSSLDAGVAVRDAAVIAPNEGGHLAVSNHFRYRLLAKTGGLWADMDVVALRSGAALPAGAFVASEKRRPFRHREETATGESLTQVTNCFMANPAPQPGDLWHAAADTVAALPVEARTFEATGPALLTRLMLKSPDHGVEILPPDSVDPVAWWNVPAYFMEDRGPPATPFMHMYQSIWAKRGVDCNAAFPVNSLAGRLWRDNGL